ncbi:MAG TPA: hypothetical protein VNL95_09980 [Dehalococcoidia bacterium]|nr:hypothetical protein [Dehalococcoidia bacterium]
MGRAVPLLGVLVLAALASWLLVRLASSGPEEAGGEPAPAGDAVERETQLRQEDAAQAPFWGTLGPFHIVPEEQPSGSDEEQRSWFQERFKTLWGLDCQQPVAVRRDSASNPFYIVFGSYVPPFYTVCANGQVLASGVGEGFAPEEGAGDALPFTFTRRAIAKVPVGIEVRPTPLERLQVLSVRGMDVLVEKPVPGTLSPVTRFWVIERYPEPGRQGVLTLVVVPQELSQALPVLEEVLAVAERFPPR